MARRAAPVSRIHHARGPEDVAELIFDEGGAIEFYTHENFQLLLKPIFEEIDGVVYFKGYSVQAYPAEFEMQADF